MTQPTLRILARMSALPDRIEEVKALLISLLEPTRQEPGCLKYELLQNELNLAEFTFVEEWESETAMKAHLNSPHVIQALSRASGLLASGPDILPHKLLN